MIRKGKSRGIPQWYCHSCSRYFSSRFKPKTEEIIAYYQQGKYTISDVALAFEVSASTVKRILRHTPPSRTTTMPSSCVLQLDTTYWGRRFAVVIFMDSASHRVLYHKFIEGKEQLSDYHEGIAYLQSQGVKLLGIVADGFQGLREAFPDIPFQYCQFHQMQRIRQLLTSNPRLQASIELKQLVARLSQANRKDFTHALELWYDKWRSFLAEKTWLSDEKWIYTHRRIRAAYYSLKRHLEVLFTYEALLEAKMPKTNNAIEALNSILKMRLRIHRGISAQRRRELIANLLSAYNPLKQKI